MIEKFKFKGNVSIYQIKCKRQGGSYLVVLNQITEVRLFKYDFSLATIKKTKSNNIKIDRTILFQRELIIGIIFEKDYLNSPQLSELIGRNS
jgi:hypothetical protein